MIVVSITSHDASRRTRARPRSFRRPRRRLGFRRLGRRTPAHREGLSRRVLEAGRRFADHELPTTSWRLRDYVWAPALGLFGVQRIHPLRDVLVMAGAGVGGGSLNYANTLYRPPAAFFDDPHWSAITDWPPSSTPSTTRPPACSA